MGGCTSEPATRAGEPDKTLLVNRKHANEQLLDGYMVGDTVYFSGTLYFGVQGEVLGPAMLGSLSDKCLKVKFPCNDGPVDCALTCLSRTEPERVDAEPPNDEGPGAFNSSLTTPMLTEPKPVLVVEHKEEVLPTEAHHAIATPSVQSEPTLFAAVNQHFAQSLTMMAPEICNDAVLDVDREHLMRGFEELIVLLDAISEGRIGCYLTDNVHKLRTSQASAAETSYRPWLISELPVHAAAGYKGYVDKSAWMANLWNSWTLEFFVEFFALL